MHVHLIVQLILMSQHHEIQEPQVPQAPQDMTKT